MDEKGKKRGEEKRKRAKEEDVVASSRRVQESAGKRSKTTQKRQEQSKKARTKLQDAEIQGFTAWRELTMCDCDLPWCFPPKPSLSTGARRWVGRALEAIMSYGLWDMGMDSEETGYVKGNRRSVVDSRKKRATWLHLRSSTQAASERRGFATLSIHWMSSCRHWAGMEDNSQINS